MKKTFHDLATLAARMGVGGIFVASGWQKLEAGLKATEAQFAQLDAPASMFWAVATLLIELVGGTMLIAGLAVATIGLLLFAEALAVFVLAAGDPGLPLAGGSVQLIVALGAASVLIAVTGAGRVSVDHMVVIKRREAEEADDFAADAEADAVINALRDPSRPAKKNVDADPPQGPVTFPASSGSSEPEVTETLAKPKAARRPRKGGEESTESRSEAPPDSEKPAGAEPGDTLVAGRRAGKTTG